MILFYYFLILNFLAFLFLGYDKRLAIKKQRRIPEKTLLTLVLMGGTIGSGLGMLAFKHKTSKDSYLLKFYGIITVQVFILFGLFYFRIIEL
ncbi:DUF1294 domain-containing protein [Flavobacterium maritimum]|jgi:uncharacterized membrane protein YsdA (DUF1294 family)|uniref:DUF1294 domain-containing protein n=1 Tax=Flavobacterium maritimum TaxID=3149042 RepID=UPI0032B49D2A